MVHTENCQSVNKLDELLDIWVRYFKSDSASGRWFPRRSAGFEDSPSNYCVTEEDADIIYNRNDVTIALTVQAKIDSLTDMEKHAVYRVHGISTVWRFPRFDINELYISARHNLHKMLKRHGFIND